MRSLIFGPKNHWERVFHDPTGISEAVLFGTAASTAAEAMATSAAVATASGVPGAGLIASLPAATTSGLIGTGGAFSLGTTLTNLATAGSIASSVMGGVGRLTAGNAAEAEAKAMEKQAKAAERQQINKDLDVLGRQRAIGASSGLDVSGGSPLAVFSDSIRDLEMNAANVRKSGQMQADQRRAEAQQQYTGIPGAIVNPLLQNKTLLSQIMRY